MFVCLFAVSINAIDISDILGTLHFFFSCCFLSCLFSGVKMTKCQFTCPEGQVKKINPKHTPSFNGCGTEEAKIDVSEFEGLENCCIEHDLCYDTCNIADRKDWRKHCDDQFSDCLATKCYSFGNGTKKRNKCMEAHSLLGKKRESRRNSFSLVLVFSFCSSCWSKYVWVQVLFGCSKKCLPLYRQRSKEKRGIVTKNFVVFIYFTFFSQKHIDPSMYVSTYTK